MIVHRDNRNGPDFMAVNRIKYSLLKISLRVSLSNKYPCSQLSNFPTTDILRVPCSCKLSLILFQEK
jgi:hypothetical protein